MSKEELEKAAREYAMVDDDNVRKGSYDIREKKSFIDGANYYANQQKAELIEALYAEHGESFKMYNQSESKIEKTDWNSRMKALEFAIKKAKEL